MLNDPMRVSARVWLAITLVFASSCSTGTRVSESESQVLYHPLSEPDSTEFWSHFAEVQIGASSGVDLDLGLEKYVVLSQGSTVAQRVLVACTGKCKPFACGKGKTLKPGCETSPTCKRSEFLVSENGSDSKEWLQTITPDEISAVRKIR